MKEIHQMLKSFDIKIWIGNISSAGLVGLSTANIESVFRIFSLIIACAVGVVTFRYTQEKRKFLKQQKAESED
jgi:hypothetical protein